MERRPRGRGGPSGGETGPSEPRGAIPSAGSKPPCFLPRANVCRGPTGAQEREAGTAGVYGLCSPPPLALRGGSWAEDSPKPLTLLPASGDAGGPPRVKSRHWRVRLLMQITSPPCLCLNFSLLRNGNVRIYLLELL